VHKGHKFFPSTFTVEISTPAEISGKKTTNLIFKNGQKSTFDMKNPFFQGITCYVCHIVWKPSKWPKRPKVTFSPLQNIKITKNYREIQNWKFMFFSFFCCCIFSQKNSKSKFQNLPDGSTGFKCFCGAENYYTDSFWHIYHDSRPQGSIFRILKKSFLENFPHFLRLGIFLLKTVVKKILKNTNFHFNFRFLDDFLIF